MANYNAGASMEDYDGHTISIDPGEPCGRGVYTGQDIRVLGQEGWWKSPRKQVGFCEKPKNHAGPCTHLLSIYHRRPDDIYRP